MDRKHNWNIQILFKRECFVYCDRTCFYIWISEIICYLNWGEVGLYYMHAFVAISLPNLTINALVSFLGLVSYVFEITEILKMYTMLIELIKNC